MRPNVESGCRGTLVVLPLIASSTKLQAQGTPVVLPGPKIKLGLIAHMSNASREAYSRAWYSLKCLSAL